MCEDGSSYCFVSTVLCCARDLKVLRVDEVLLDHLDLRYMSCGWCYFFFVILNGLQGEDGADGARGDDGADGPIVS